MPRDLCRICLGANFLSNIFRCQESMKISSKIMSLANITIAPNDGLPDKICNMCVNKLNDCISFVRLCESSDKRYRDMLDNTEIEKSPSVTELEMDLSQDKFPECQLFTDTDPQNVFMVLNESNTEDTHDDDDLKISKKQVKQQCSTCGKVMSSRFRLKTHLRTHTGERPFSCPHCKKNFALAQNLKVHLRVHTGEKPLQCSVCGESFAHSAGLATHRRKHTGQTPYHCVLCPRSFRTVGHLQYHVRKDGAMPLQIRSNGVFIFLRQNLLTIFTIIGVLSGTLLGWSLRASGIEWSRRDVMYFQYPGELFLRMLKGLIVPLLVSSIISAIGSLDLSLSGKVGLRAIIYYMTTTVCAVMLGIALVTTIKPGNDPEAATSMNTTKVVMKDTLTSDTLLDLIRNVFPENVAQATIASYRTRLVYDEKDTHAVKGHPETYEIKGDYQNGSNVLGLVAFSIVMGITLGKMGDKSKPLQDFFHSLSEAMMIITGWVIWLSPLGVFFLITAKIMEIDSFADLVGRLGLYFVTVLLGLFLHGFGTLSVLFILATKKLPCRYIAKMGQVMATAFGTASSSATMPITIGCCDEMGLDPRITRFVIPIGATINMDGTALYEAVAAIFIAQLRKVDMSFGKIIAVSVTATAASIGAAGIPQAGLVTMVMVLDTVNLPAEDVSIILAVDWLLDRFRTTINVVCDALGAIIVASLSQGDLDNEKNRTAQNDRELAPAQELTELEKGDH